MKLYIEGSRLQLHAEEMLAYAKTVGCMCEDIFRIAEDMAEMSSAGPAAQALKEAAGRLEHKKAAFYRMSGLLPSVYACYQKAEEEFSRIEYHTWKEAFPGNCIHRADISAEETGLWMSGSLPEPVLCAAVPPVCLEHPEWLRFV